MKEIRILLFTSVRDDAQFKTLTGATASDPRIFFEFTPQKVIVNDNKPAYAVYYRTGTIQARSIDIAGRDEQVYAIEIWAKKPDICDDIADRLVEKFRDQQYLTTSYKVLRTYGLVAGSPQLNEGRKLYTLTVNIYFTKIVQTVGVS